MPMQLHLFEPVTCNPKIGGEAGELPINGKQRQSGVRSSD
jgi:hypothetical protein